jgi:serine/threonine protein kinase
VKKGRLHLELLERFGEDLLQVVDWLEQEGVPHRDIKPENLGVALMGKSEQLHLVLFDFSLADTPAGNVRAGTVPYLDPFLALRKPPRWDTYAERFPEAAAERKKLPAEDVEATAGADEAPSIDVLATLLVPAGRTKGSKASARVVESLLGLVARAASSNREIGA